MHFMISLFTFGIVQILTNAHQETPSSVIRTICSNLTRIDEKYIEKLSMGDFNFDDENVKRRFFCDHFWSKKINFKGEFDKEAFLEGTSIDFMGNSSIFFDKCAKKKSKKRYENAWLMVKCLNEEYQELFLPEEMENEAVKCVNETGVLIKHLWKINRGDLSINDMRVNNFTLCLLKDKFVIDENGYLNMTTIESHFLPFIYNRIIETMKDCLIENRINDALEAWRGIKCMSQGEIDILRFYADNWDNPNIHIHV